MMPSRRQAMLTRLIRDSLLSTLLPGANVSLVACGDDVRSASEDSSSTSSSSSGAGSSSGGPTGGAGGTQPGAGGGNTGEAITEQHCVSFLTDTALLVDGYGT